MLAGKDVGQQEVLVVQRSTSVISAKPAFRRKRVSFLSAGTVTARRLPLAHNCEQRRCLAASHVTDMTTRSRAQAYRALQQREIKTRRTDGTAALFCFTVRAHPRAGVCAPVLGSRVSTAELERPTNWMSVPRVVFVFVSAQSCTLARGQHSREEGKEGKVALVRASPYFKATVWSHRAMSACYLHATDLPLLCDYATQTSSTIAHPSTNSIIKTQSKAERSSSRIPTHDKKYTYK